MRSIFLIFFHLLLIFAHGQSKIPEQFYARTDRPYYIQGEHLWYHVYGLFRDHSTPYSKIVHVEIVDPVGTIVLHQKLNMSPAGGSGDFKLETHWNPGWYRLRVYSNWNGNFSPMLFHQQRFLLLGLPDKEAEAKVDSALVASLSTRPNLDSASNYGLLIEVNKPYFAPREEVSLTLALSDEVGKSISANVSISIVQAKYFADSLPNSFGIQQAKQLRQSELELRDESIEMEQSFKIPVFITNASDEPLTSSFVQGISLQSGSINYAQASNGHCLMEFDELYGENVIQFFDPNPFDAQTSLNVKVKEPTLNLPTPTPWTEAIPLTSPIKAYQAYYLQQLVLEKLFQTSEAFKPQAPSLPPRQLTPTVEYRTDEYIQFKNLFDFLDEAVFSIRVRTPPKRFKRTIPFSKGPMTGKMISFLLFSKVLNTEPIELQYVVPVMYAVNDYLFYDTDLLLEIEWENVESLEIHQILEILQAEFGLAAKSGILGLRTKDLKTPKRITEAKHNIHYTGFHSPNKYQNPAYDKKGNELSKIPDYRAVNYWNPQVFIPPQQTSQLSFSTLDAAGWYLITVEGVTDKGKPVWGKALFEVQLDAKTPTK